MERLTGRDAYGDIVANEEMQIIASRGTTYDDLHNIINHLAEKLCEYEDLEEQGRMIIFPCNKGDKIYEFYHECVECRLEAGETPEDIISMRRVRYFGYDGDEAYIYASQALPVRLFNNDEPFCIPVSEIGKTVFLTKLEAEIRLKELRNMENKEAEAAMDKLKGKDNKDIERDIERD